MKKSIIALLTMMAATATQAVSIGQWNIHLAYYDITDIEPAGELVYVLSSKDLFSYNVKDKSVYAYDKTNLLADTEIKFIAWNPTVKRLIVVYTNYNIDLLDNNGKSVNISDYYTKDITGDKTINNVTVDDNYAYLATGFGIVKVNMRNAEISETYNIGKKVIDCAVKDGSIYANTAEGKYKGVMTDNLSDPMNWNETTESISFPTVIDRTSVNGYTEYYVKDDVNNCFWSNQKDGCLQGWEAESGTTAAANRTIKVSDINPDGPKYNEFGFIRYAKNKLYTVNGKSGNNAHVQVFDEDNNKWELYDESFVSTLGHRYLGNYSIDVDPLKDNHVFVAGQTGLYEFQDGIMIKHYTNNNSPLETASSVGNNNKNYVMATSNKFDANGSLWITNSISAHTSLLELTRNGEFVSHHQSSFMDNTKTSMQDMRGLYFDSRSLLWFANNDYRKPCVTAYNTSTKEATIFENFINQDGIQYNVFSVRCLAEDKYGNIWIGTGLGPFYITAEDIRNKNTDYFNQYKVSRNDGSNLADYLLSGVDISQIVVDAANRKWIGTNGSGVYLISADNNVQEQHFTSDNSPLLSNDIISIAINDETGEVFFGTEKGLCSYMSDASQTSEDMDKDNVWAYPNPVKPDYTGLITITGLSFNADVKICTSNGVLVNEGRSTGGTYTWNGRDLNGNKVASGVYMVQTAKSDGGSGTVCKIAIVK